LQPLSLLGAEKVKVKATPCHVYTYTARMRWYRCNTFVTPALHGGGWWATPRTCFTAEKDPAPNVLEAGWASWLFWRDMENLGPTGILSPDCPVRSESLYWIHYPSRRVLKRMLRIRWISSAIGRQKVTPSLDSLHIVRKHHVLKCQLKTGLDSSQNITRLIKLTMIRRSSM